MSAVEILRQARELISERSNWGQGSYAVDADGQEVQPESPRAKCWCVKGAAAHFIGPTWTTGDLPLMYLDMAASKYGTGVAEAINDGEVRIGDVDPYSAVMVVLDEAIKLAEADNA